jgi:hypothetical protein
MVTTNDPPVRRRCFGYARVSTDDQDLSLQIDALIRFGIDTDDIFTDKISGAWLNSDGGIVSILGQAQVEDGTSVLQLRLIDQNGWRYETSVLPDFAYGTQFYEARDEQRNLLSKVTARTSSWTD